MTDSEHARFEAGRVQGLDPLHALSTAVDRPVETTTASPWFHTACRVCGHTFRTGDMVRTGADGQPVHDFTGLPCAGGTGERQDASCVEPFYAGLREAWPVTDGHQVVRLTAADALVTAPPSGFTRDACHVCRHTFRALDLVVRCPCGLDRAHCRVAIHADPLRQLRCWDSWAAMGKADYCVATGRPVRAPRPL